MSVYVMWFHPKQKLDGGCGCNQVDTVCHPIQGGALLEQGYILALFGILDIRIVLFLLVLYVVFYYYRYS